MGYEIDFLAVERGEKSGDAIAFRIGNLHGRREEQFVGIVDGGYTENGGKLVKHVRDFYGTNIVDLVVLATPDDDHALGLESVLENMDVRLLWMHQPWNHAEKIRRMFTNDRLTTGGLSDKFTRSLEAGEDGRENRDSPAHPHCRTVLERGDLGRQPGLHRRAVTRVLPAAAVRFRLRAQSQSGVLGSPGVLRRRRVGGGETEAREVGHRDIEQLLRDERGEQLQHLWSSMPARSAGCSPGTRALRR